ncbi:MAG: ERCC4 domain-containing protein [Pseudomonadota bacterium]
MMPTILVDTREQTPWRFSDGVAVETCSLPSGDYSLKGFTDVVAVERKSLPDLVACCTAERERFLDCCRRLSDYVLRLVVVEASVDDVLAHAYRSRTNPQSVIGTALAIHVDYGVPTIWAGDARNAANLVERMLTRLWRKQMERAA